MVSIDFISRASVKNNQAVYTDINVDVSKILESWKLSVFAHHWLTSDGAIKDVVDLSDKNKERRTAAEQLIADGKPLEKPILGIGIYDNIEIGAGTAELCVATLHNIKTIPVHIRTTNLDDFKPYIV